MESDEEDFVTVGKPLPEYAEDEVPQKPTPYQLQSVTDKRGRAQRFHGAFTGGFSAGFFNSVGSKEGFKPSTFVSSKSVRAEKQAGYSAEDFMDDEDFAEHGIAPRMVKTTSEFTSVEQSRKRRGFDHNDDDILSASSFLQDVIIPASVPVGVMLLRKLGWRDGQGVGPRRRKKVGKQRAKAGVKVYGCALPPTTSGGESENSSEDEYAKDFTFAPKDVNPISFAAKDNVHGLGYRGLDPSLALGGSSHINLFDQPKLTSSQVSSHRFGHKGPQHKNRKGITGHAFGVGSLQDDDEDIYGLDSMDKYDRELGEPESDAKFGWTAPKSRVGNNKPSGSKCDVIDGFKVSSSGGRPKKVYPAPRLPRDFRPFHRWDTPISESKSGGQTGQKSSKEHFSRQTASTRAEQLGETPQVKSVFELIPKSDRDRIKMTRPATASSSSSSSQSMVTSPAIVPTERETGSREADSSSQRSDVSSVLEQRKAATPLFAGASTGGATAFKPFASDLAKQQRYENYLQITKEGGKYGANESLSESMTEWERDREREEFARASQLYRPLSAIMAARFTSAKHKDDPSEATATVPEQKAPLSDHEKAANMKMYGKLTREVYTWIPDRMLCRRFNVPNPYPEATSVGVPKVKRDKFSLFNFLTVPETPKEPPTQQDQKALPAPPVKPEKSAAKTGPVEESISMEVPVVKLEPGLDQAEASTSSEEPSAGNKATDIKVEAQEEEPERPSMDLFKAIFEDSGSESSSSDEDEEETTVNTNVILDSQTDTSATKATMPTPGGSTTNYSNTHTQLIIGKDREKSRTSVSVKDDSDSESDVMIVEESVKSENQPSQHNVPAAAYGPVPPPNFEGASSSIPYTKPSSERKEKKHKHKNKSRSKEKHKQKKKKDKKKKKHKHKKSSKRKKARSSSDSSSDSDSNSEDERGDGPSTALLLNRLKNITPSKRLTAADFM